jgi:hypothetical protein
VYRTKVHRWALVGFVMTLGCASEVGDDPSRPPGPGRGGGSAFGGAGGNVGSGTGGTSGSSGSSGTSGAGGTAGASGASGASGSSGGGAQPNTLPGFTNLAPPMGAPLDPNQATALTPPPPAGWSWYPIDGAICRDGSPNGIYVRFTTSDKLLIYLEGGGACSNLGFCNYNPASVDKVLSGDGQSVIGSALGVVAGRQQPGVYSGGLAGIFDTASATNPFKDWNMVYVPYCTGDVHFGTKPNATVPGVAAPQQFVGYLNMQKFVGRVVPTFKDKVDRVVITGASAGSFGAALNVSMVQDAFGSVLVDALLDSGAPFSDQYMPPCMQKRWREGWGFAGALPPDCEECKQADGGGMIKLADFLIRKHPNSTIAAVTAINDEVIRLFFSVGQKNCATFDTADPVAITMGQILDPTVLFAAADYEAGMKDLRERYKGSGRFATYFMGGFNSTVHQHIFRARFTDPAAGSETIAQFTTNWLNGQFEQIGP